MFGLVRRRHAIRFQKTATVHEPVEHVFELWSNPENFSRIMSHVEEVKKTGNNAFAGLCLALLVHPLRGKATSLSSSRTSCSRGGVRLAPSFAMPASFASNPSTVEQGYICKCPIPRRLGRGTRAGHSLWSGTKERA